MKELREQRMILQQHQEMLEKMQRAAKWGFIMNVLRFLLILIPFIIAFIYLPPLIQNALEAFYSGSGETMFQLPKGLDLGELAPFFER